MGQAGMVLKKVLEDYRIDPTVLANELGVAIVTIKNWSEEVRDPHSESVRAIVRVLGRIDPAAAETFKALYW